MSTFDKHLENIANAISVDADTSNHLEKDFRLIKLYLLDLLRQDPLFGPIIVCRTEADKFNCSLIFDFSRYVPLGALQTRYPSFIKLGQRGRFKIHGMQDMPFFSKNGDIAAGIITSIVRGLIGQGLDLSGYFVRGHKGDIYELELLNEMNILENSFADCDKEWQTHYIMVQATTEGITMKIRLRVLLKFCSNEEPKDFMPFPTHRLKMIWLAAADVRYLEYFSLCSPLTERELSELPVNLIALRLLSALFAHINLYTLKKNHLESVSYAIIYNRSQKGIYRSMQNVANVIIVILQRMQYYFEKNMFPYYWNIKQNMICSIKRNEARVYTRDRLHDLLNQIQNMRHKETTYEEVECFFGVQINSQIYNIDEFGIYRYFKEP